MIESLRDVDRYIVLPSQYFGIEESCCLGLVQSSRIYCCKNVIIGNLREDEKIEKASRCEIVFERSIDGWENINMAMYTLPLD